MQSLDLHPVFRSSRDLDAALRTFLVRAAATRQASVAIIHGEGSGRLRTRVVAFLEQPHARGLYRSYEFDAGDTGRRLVHLR